MKHFIGALRVTIVLITAAAPLMAVPLKAEADTAGADVSLISQGTTTTGLNVYSGTEPSVSDDGRYVAFLGAAEKPNGIASNQIFVKDTATGSLQTVSVNNNGDLANQSVYAPAISRDGRYVVYASNSTNLVDNDTNGTTDIFVRDISAGTTTRVSVSSDGEQANGSSSSPTISGDGRYVVFSSYATNLVDGDTNNAADVFMHDMQTGVTTRISVNSNGDQTACTISYCSTPNSEINLWINAVSYNGRYVLFQSMASNLTSVPLIGSYPAAQVYMRDTVAGTTTLVSETYDGRQSRYGGQSVSLTDDGRYVVFGCGNSAYGCGLTPDGDNGIGQLYLRDMVAGTTTKISVNGQGVQGSSAPAGGFITDDGKTVVFGSSSSNLTTEDLNGVTNIFVRDLAAGTTNLIPATTTGTLPNASIRLYDASSDGRYVVFSSTASNLTSDPANGNEQVFLLDRFPIPSSPTNLTVKSPAQYPALSWDSVAGATSYNIYRDGSKIGSATSANYTDSSAPEGNDSYYVTAVNSAGESPPSNAVNVVVDHTAPSVSNLQWSANPLLEGQDTALTATVSDNLSGVSQVEYSINGGPPQPMTYDPVSGEWIATFGSNLAASTYNITVTATDNAGNTSSGTNDILAVYTTANGYVTGHAKLQPTVSDTMPISLDTSKHPANLVLGFTNVTAPMSGSFDLDYSIKNNQNEFSLSSSSIDWVVVPDSSHASVLGQADMTTYVDGVKTVTQNMSVRFDLTLGVNGSPDQISIKIFSPGVDPSTGSPAYVINETDANNSNLMIHP